MKNNRICVFLQQQRNKSYDMASHNELGLQGEAFAAQYLEDNGYMIRHRNWKSFSGKEIDIVAEKDGTLVFVEVKTRKSALYGQPFEAVDKRKTYYLVAAAKSYMRVFSWFRYVRFDIISLLGARPPFQLQHIESAFDPHML